MSQVYSVVIRVIVTLEIFTLFFEELRFCMIWRKLRSLINFANNLSAHIYSMVPGARKSPHQMRIYTGIV